MRNCLAFLGVAISIPGSASFHHSTTLHRCRRNQLSQAKGDDSIATVNGSKLSQHNDRPVDFPPYVSDVVDGDEEKSQVPLFVLQEGDEDEAATIYRADVDRCVPAKTPWWFGFVDDFNFQLGPIKIVSKAARDTRLRTERSYSRKGSYSNANACAPPTLRDLSTPQVDPAESLWISLPARLLSYAVAYFSFPFITRFVDSFVTMPADQLDEITSKFGPGISILYGTFISLTLSILYNRQKTIQEVVSVETSKLSLVAQNMISLFRNDSDRAVRAAQAIADQIRILVSSSRGVELLILVYSDPYARLRELVDEYELDEDSSQSSTLASLPSNCRDVIKDLCQSRAMRLSDESLALPPTHFFILNVLTLFMLVGFTVNIIPTVDRYGSPSSESSLLFAALFAIYILFFNFASDLNVPFQGVYQVRRSTASAHLLQLKWFLANHRLLRGKVDFEKPVEDETASSVRIESPGLGEFWFHKL